MTVRGYVEFAATIKGVVDVPTATADALRKVGLGEVAHRLIDHLSKGYRQRVGLAQALVHNPRVLILDEPTSGLDPAQRVEIRNLIEELAAGERTVILSTHVLGEIEAICSRVMIINHGRLVAPDAIEKLGGDGRVVRLMVANRGAEVGAALASVPGVVSVEEDGELYVVRGATDLRAAVAAAALPFGLLELNGRERLEDIYLKLTARGAA
jgi:ABC-2 type transport system ATP-binding protein